MFIQHLCRRQVEVLLRYMYSALSKRVHTRFGAHAFQFGAGTPVHFFGNLGEIDTAGEIHGARVDPEDVCAGFDAVRRLAKGYGRKKAQKEELTWVAGIQFFYQFAQVSEARDRGCLIDSWP